MDEASSHAAPAIRVLATDDDDIDRHSEVAQRAMEAHRLLGLVVNLGLDHKEIDIAVRAGRATRMRAEQNHLRIGRGLGQAASRLGDQGLVNCPHD